MKSILALLTSKNLLYSILPILCLSISLAGFTNRTFYVPRSQGANIARDDVGWSHLLIYQQWMNFMALLP